MELVDPIPFALTTSDCGPVVFRICWEYLYDLKYHAFKGMVGFVEMYGYSRFSFDMRISYMFILNLNSLLVSPTYYLAHFMHVMR